MYSSFLFHEVNQNNFSPTTAFNCMLKRVSPVLSLRQFPNLAETRARPQISRGPSGSMSTAMPYNIILPTN